MKNKVYKIIDNYVLERRIGNGQFGEALNKLFIYY